MRNTNTGKILAVLLLAVSLTGTAERVSGTENGHGVLEAMEDFLSGEPAEVRALRRMAFEDRDEGHYEYYYDLLSEEGKQIYREILMAAREYRPEFYLTSADETEINRAYRAVLKDHPEVYWIHGRESIYTTIYPTYTVMETGSLYSQEEIAEIGNSIEEDWQTVCSYFEEDTSDYRKVHTVYAWVIQNTEYLQGYSDQNIGGVFHEGQAVCAGYAGAVKYLLDRLDIPCIYVEGSAVSGDDAGTGHAWNLVKLDGEWYYLDATNGDQPAFLQAEGMDVQPVLFDYLCPFPEEYERIYRAEEDFALPETYAVSYNDAVLTGGMFSWYDESDVWNYAVSMIDQGYSRIRLKFQNAQEYEAACGGLIDGGQIQEIAGYYMDVYGIYEIRYHYGELEDLNTIYLMF